ncbi:putative bifunctional diguanylate cyclase/phosphodiesterase [Pseudoalteromonas sp.]|uniref:putative bifunctional diguanylate cyclase/phosphodiesterase n=1 Tax=Pseudoalteromonas sp. TaxID=53249 RepID=UPI003569065B
MRFPLTQSAASIVYLAFIQFFLVVTLLGALESIVVTQHFMAIIPLPLALCTLVLAIILNGLAKFTVPKKLSYSAPVLAILGAVLFFNLQLSLWHDTSVSWFYNTNNPYIASLVAVIVGSFFLALIIRVSHPVILIKDSKLTKTVVLFTIFIGTSLWHVTAVQTISRADANARSNIHLLETILNKNLEDQIKSLTHIKTRLESIHTDYFFKLAKLDMDGYTQDFEIIKSMLILDNELNYIDGTTFAKQFIANGRLATPAIVSWLKAADDEVRFAANSATLDSDMPIIMFSIPIKATSGERYQILALLNLNLLIESRYIDHLNSFNTFIELNPNIYFSINPGEHNVRQLSELFSKYSQHFVVEQIEVMALIKHNVYNFIKDYTKLRNAANIDQAILWLTFVFTYIFILAADSTLKLREQSFALHKMAKYDELTGLLRRDALNAEIESKQLNNIKANCAVVFYNLDGFSAVNNSLGHELGDSVLQQVAQRLKTHALSADSIARFGNDEFILHYSDADKAQLSAETTLIIKSLAEIYNLGEVDIHLTVSVGIAMSEKQQVKPKTLLQQADIAMDSAKALGGNQFSFYQKEMDDRHQEMVKTRGELQKAINNGGLEVYYQPIYDLSSHAISSVECLVRWKNNENYISPAVFIPIAEQTGQILQVGEKVLTQVLHDISNTPELQRISVAVNFSPQQVQQHHFVKNLAKLVNEKNIHPSQLTIEVTEMVMSEKGAIEGVLKDLITTGFNVAIDDFGTGYSSLSYLSRQPANIIKIDREFTIGAEQPGQKRALLEAIINICIELNKVVVIEGVEDFGLISYLSKFNNIKIQGYYYCKPLRLPHLVDHINGN